MNEDSPQEPSLGEIVSMQARKIEEMHTASFIEEGLTVRLGRAIAGSLVEVRRDEARSGYLAQMRITSEGKMATAAILLDEEMVMRAADSKPSWNGLLDSMADKLRTGVIQELRKQGVTTVETNYLAAKEAARDATEVVKGMGIRMATAQGGAKSFNDAIEKLRLSVAKLDNLGSLATGPTATEEREALESIKRAVDRRP